MDLYVSCPAVSQRESFMWRCGVSFLLFATSFEDFLFGGGGVVVEEDEDDVAGLLMLYSRLAGGPTGTIRDPNSTPMVTSWWDTKRPSHRRIVS